MWGNRRHRNLLRPEDRRQDTTSRPESQHDCEQRMIVSPGYY